MRMASTVRLDGCDSVDDGLAAPGLRSATMASMRATRPPIWALESAAQRSQYECQPVSLVAAKAAPMVRGAAQVMQSIGVPSRLVVNLAAMTRAYCSRRVRWCWTRWASYRLWGSGSGSVWTLSRPLQKCREVRTLRHHRSAEIPRFLVSHGWPCLWASTRDDGAWYLSTRCRVSHESA